MSSLGRPIGICTSTGVPSALLLYVLCRLLYIAAVVIVVVVVVVVVVVQVRSRKRFWLSHSDGHHSILLLFKKEPSRDKRKLSPYSYRTNRTHPRRQTSLSESSEVTIRYRPPHSMDHVTVHSLAAWAAANPLPHYLHLSAKVHLDPGSLPRAWRTRQKYSLHDTQNDKRNWSSLFWLLFHQLATKKKKKKKSVRTSMCQFPCRTTSSPANKNRPMDAHLYCWYFKSRLCLNLTAIPSGFFFFFFFLFSVAFGLKKLSSSSVRHSF